MRGIFLVETHLIGAMKQDPPHPHAVCAEFLRASIHSTFPAPLRNTNPERERNGKTSSSAGAGGRGAEKIRQSKHVKRIEEEDLFKKLA